MTKAEIIDIVAEKTLKPRSTCELIVNTMIDTIINVLKEDDDVVQIRGLCTFEVATRSDRRGVDIHGNEKIFKGGQYVKIKPSDGLKRLF